MNDVGRTYDAVILGDCIEHMRKSVGLDLLNFLVYRSSIIVVKFPVQMIQARTRVTRAKRMSRCGPNTTSEGWTASSPSKTISASPWSGAI
jgi:hypothetical protein